MPDQGSIIGGYRIEDVLGRGGMGTVYRARHLESGRTVALKVLTTGGDDPGRAARLRSEGRAQAALAHPHVVTVYEAGESGEGPWLAMQLVDGPSLAELLERSAIDARRALALLGQVAEALDAAHAQGLVHRDVKPHNVLVGEGDHAYLADFGLTRVDPDSALSAPGTIAGTFAYLAPEVIRGGDAVPASDLYAFAAMAFEALTGTVLFPRSTSAAVLQAHLQDPPPRAGARRPELGDELDEPFHRALAKDPSERPRKAVAFADDLRRRMERAGTAALPPPPPAGSSRLGAHATTADSAVALPAPAPAGRRASRRAVALAALAGAAVVGAVWIAVGADAGETSAAAPATGVADDRPGLRYLGADLNGKAGQALDCTGEAPTADSPGCTIAQAALPGATVVVPDNGAIRRWGVRGAKGELTLAVIRPREGGAFQVALSRTEAVGSAEVQWFDTDVGVERGDLVALRVTPGSGVGVRPGTRGARTERWLPALGGVGRPADRPGGSGYDHELLLRVGMVPGGEMKVPDVTSGSAAARLRAGKVRERQTLKFDRRPIRVELVELDGRFVIDEYAGKRRLARIPVTDMRPGGLIVAFRGAAWAPDAGGVDLAYVNPESGRLVLETYDVADGASRASADLPAGTVVGGFRVARVLGRGPRATVYEATQLSLGRPVALKVLHDDELAERIRHLSWPDHPGAVSLYATGTGEHGPWLAMRLVPGGTLQTRTAPLDAVTAALGRYHRDGHVHGGVHARNVLVAGGHAYLTDFGLGPATATQHDDRAALSALVALHGTRRARQRRRRIAGAVAAVAAIIAAVALLVLPGRDDPPPVPAGTQPVGSDLAPGDIETRDCAGRVPDGASRTCSISQRDLDGRPVVVPEAGTITSWAVRGARGTLALQVLRGTGATLFEVERSPDERVADPESVHVARAQIAVAAGDRLALYVTPGTGIGLRRGGRDARTDRWFGPLYTPARPPERPAGSGLDREVLLRVDVRPGGTIPAVAALRGAPAATAPDGRHVGELEVVLADDMVRKAAVTVLGGAVALDVFDGSRRVARLPVAGADGRGRLAALATDGDDAVRVRWRNPGGREVVRRILVR